MTQEKGQQDVLKDIKAGGNVSIGDVSVEMGAVTGPREIIVSGVGESPPNLKDSWVERTQAQTAVMSSLKQCAVTEIVSDGGFGKSWLAAWAYSQSQDRYDKKLWVNFREEFWQDYGFDQFARWVLQEIGFPQKDPLVQEAFLLRELIYRLNDPNTPLKTLVVMDNLEPLREHPDWDWFEQFLQLWAAQGLGSRILVTIRPERITQNFVALRGLSLSEGNEFLRREGLLGDQFEELIELTLGHPLLLKFTTAWLKQSQHPRVDHAAILFFRRLFDRFPSNQASLAEAKVELIFDEVFRSLPETSQLFLLRVSVYRQPFDIAMGKVMRGSELQHADIPENLTEIQEEVLTECNRLSQQSLLVEEAGKFTLHPLVAQLIKNYFTPEILEQAHEQAISFYQSHYQIWDGTIASCQQELEAFYHACALEQYYRAHAILDRCYRFLDRAGYWRELNPLLLRLAKCWKERRENSVAKGRLWMRLGHLRLNRGEIQLSIEAYVKAQAIFAAFALRIGQAASLGSLGNAYYALGDYQKAIVFHNKSLSIKEEIRDRPVKATSLGNLGLVHHALGNYQEAITLYNQSLDIKKEIGDRLGKATALGNLGLAYHALGNYQKAITLYNQSLDIQKEIGDRPGEAISLGNLGLAYHALGNYQKAITLYNQSLDIDKAIGDRSGEATSLGNLGNAYSSLGDYQQAIALHNQSLKIQKEIGNRRGEELTLGNLGHAYSSLGDHQEAITLYNQSLDIQKEIGERPGEANSLGGLGDVYFALGNYQKAIALHNQSLDIQKEIGNRRGEANSLGSLGNAYDALGNYQEAIALQTDSLAIQKEIGDRRGAANSLWNLARIYQQKGRMRLAMKNRHQAYSIWHDMYLPVAASPFPKFVKNFVQQMGDDWAKELIANEKRMAIVLIPLSYLVLGIQTICKPLSYLQKKCKVPPQIFWFAVGLTIVLLIAYIQLL